MTAEQFIASIAPTAVDEFHKHKISAALTIAQACLEGSFGRACPRNNCFGIKADPSWHGDSFVVETTEYDANRQPYHVQASFRAYPSLGASLADHIAFLVENSRYHNLIGASWQTACKEIGAIDHYATDPAYGAKLTDIIVRYGLAKYDEMPHHTGGERMPTLIRNSKNRAAVETLQRALNRHCAHITVDGVFGPGTLRAVKAFQRAHRLAADGIVGPKTWAALGY